MCSKSKLNQNHNFNYYFRIEIWNHNIKNIFKTVKYYFLRTSTRKH